MTQGFGSRLALWLMLFGAIGLHIYTQQLLPALHPAGAGLPPAPNPRMLEAADIGENAFAAQLLSLYVQGFDAQPGVRGTLQHIDYAVLEQWLAAISSLDRESVYPLQLALLYSRVNDADKKRRMLEFVHRAFLQNPNRRWRALAEASVIARHELADLPRALRYAKSLEHYTSGPGVPGWVQQMHLLMLADMGERERAKIVLGGLIASGKVHNAYELRLLEQRLLGP